MATEFLMPKLGLTMEEGTITEWFADDGDIVEAGAALLRIETDKTETDVEAAGSGRLHRLGQVGETFACGERIGWFLDEGEEAPVAAAPVTTAVAPTAAPVTAPAPATASTVSPTASGGRVMASPLTKRLAKERNIDLRTVRGTGPGGRIVSEDLDGIVPTTTVAAPAPAPAPAAAAAAARPLVAAGAGVPATAAARQLADLLGVDLAEVAPDPHEQRITKESVALHVRRLLGGRREAAAVERTPSPATPALLPATQEPTSVVRMTGIRGTIARRMHESLAQMAQLTLFMDADLDAVVADRESRKGAGPAPSYTDYIIAAAARALREHPLVNSQITDEGVALLPAVHVGMAVALDNGLIVPVIRDTTSLDLTELSVETSRLAEAARSGSLELPDLEGGTFSVSTLGMFGVDGFTPVINPPNTAILGVGRLRDEVAVGKKGKVFTTKRLTLSLTWDHRAFDGAPAAAFCQTIVALLGRPGALDE
jgi:pyruvate dehydrogenase E2 component (dihydrolipoyllysine-residue acetyltransferase)